MDQTGPVTAISSSSSAEITPCLRAALYQAIRLVKWLTMALYKGSDWSSGRQWLSTRDQISQVTDSGPFYKGSDSSSEWQWLFTRDQICQVTDSGSLQGIRLVKWRTVALYTGSIWQQTAETNKTRNVRINENIVAYSRNYFCCGRTRSSSTFSTIIS